MSRAYKAPNKRITQRSAGGRFRRTTLEDMGMGQCKKCEAMFSIPKIEEKNGFIDPRDYREARNDCGNCQDKRGKLKVKNNN